MLANTCESDSTTTATVDRGNHNNCNNPNGDQRSGSDLLHERFSGEEEACVVVGLIEIGNAVLQIRISTGDELAHARATTAKNAHTEHEFL